MSCWLLDTGALQDSNVKSSMPNIRGKPPKINLINAHLIIQETAEDPLVSSKVIFIFSPSLILMFDLWSSTLQHCHYAGRCWSTGSLPRFQSLWALYKCQLIIIKKNKYYILNRFDLYRVHLKGMYFFLTKKHNVHRFTLNLHSLKIMIVESFPWNFTYWGAVVF